MFVKVARVSRLVGFSISLLALATLVACGGGDNGGGGGGAGGGGNITVALSPDNTQIDTSQTQQFHVTITGDTTHAGVTWAVDGTAGGSASVGTISSGGLYTPPTAKGSHTVSVTAVADTSKTAHVGIGVYLPGVYTYHNNLSRDGVFPHETTLTTANVDQTTFGKIFSCAVDGAAYTQPLWVPDLDIGGGTHNVIFVATEHDSLYAFDADASPCVTYWHANLIDTNHGGSGSEFPVPTADVGAGFGDIQPEIGITGTPVIDPVANTLYVVSKSEGPSGTFHQRLHAIDLATGNEKFGTVTVSGSVPGNGDGSSAGSVSFSQKMEHQRSGLALANGKLYIPWAAHEDADPYHGWLMSFDAGTLGQTAIYNATPNGARGGVWMGGGAAAIDDSENVYISTGNGTFDGNSGSNHDYGDSVLKISTSSGLSLADYFTPFNQLTYEQQDADVASAALFLLENPGGAHPHIVVAGSKAGNLYVLDRDSMGNYCSGCASDTQILQTISVGHALFDTPAFWQGWMYVGGLSDGIAQYTFNSGAGTFGTSRTATSTSHFPFPGATPSVSSNDTTSGIVWAIDSSAYGPPGSHGTGPAVLHAFDATDVSAELWNSAQVSADAAGNAVKFTTPTIANGKVYIGTRTEITVYGLLP